jgi:transposase
MRCMDRASLEHMLGRGLSVREIARRFGLHESTVGRWVEKHGLEAVPGRKQVALGALEQGDLERLVASGATIAEIAETVDRSKATVRHWLRRFGLKTQNGRGRRAKKSALVGKRAGLVEVRMRCAQHGETEFRLDGRGYYRCKRCRSNAVARRRRKVKATLVAEAGGGCCLCGYARNMRALHFHHLDPSEKRIEINAKGVAVALEKLRAETRKCVLLCSNCHAEVEDGMASIPADLLDKRAERSISARRSGVTQLAECSAVNRDVVGSSPTPRAALE